MSLRTWILAAALGLGACSSGLPAPATSGDAASDPIVAAPDRAKVRAALAARRAENVRRFLAYREARVYPVNTFVEGFQHVWVDLGGNLCAAATLISGDWGRQAAARVALEDNFTALAGVTDGPLLDWILTSGLTHHEIVAIQVPGFSERWGEEQERARETERLYALYVDVERQLATMTDASLDAATDALLARPDLARALLDGEVAGPGRFTPSSDEPIVWLGLVPSPA